MIDLDKDLRLACKNARLSRVKALLARGANLLTHDAYGNGPLHFLAQSTVAFGSPHKAILAVLSEAGVPIDEPNSETPGLTPMGIASHNTQWGLVALLLNLGADPNRASHDGARLLGQAAAEGHAQMVRALLVAGADVHAVDALGWTALHHVSLSPSAVSEVGTKRLVECVVLLLAAGAKVNAPTVDVGWKPPETPLQMTLRRNSWAVAERLLRAGALKGVGVRARQALLESGVEHKVWATLDVLIEHGAAVSLRPAVLENLLAQLPSSSSAHRRLESMVLHGSLTPSEGASRPRSRL